MKCSSCQFENPDSMKFCGECGAKLEMICPTCSYSNPAQFKFCGECGSNLKEPEKPTLNYSEPKSYTPRFLADKILTTRSAVEGERKFVTVLFADVANYTALSEKLDPEEVHQIMDGLFKILMDEIHKYEGTINQFTGDGVMALFGAPLSHEDHAQRACHAALAIQKKISAHRRTIFDSVGRDVAMRIGINSGHVIVGSIGDDLRMDYTAIGDTTNLAARMENHAKPGTVLISNNTFKLIRDYFDLDPIGEVRIKGKEDPQEAYELIKAGAIETRIHASAAKGLTRFVGRKNSMASLEEQMSKARDGAGQVVGIVGEAGVGKSRLILELRTGLNEEETAWLEGRCLHFGGSMPYLPMLDIIRTYFDIKEEDREFIIKKKIKKKIHVLDDTLATVIPPFQELLSLKVDDEVFTRLEPQHKREKTFEGLRDLFIRESQNRLLILVVEDLHWIDKTTEEFLNYLIGWIANTNILLILLYRPEYTHQWGSRSYYTQIGLDQLGTTSSIELVKAILEGGEVVPELRELILDRSAGNPLFIEEFTQTLLENGSIQQKNNTYILNQDSGDIKVPDTIQGIIASRLDRLEENLKQTMQVASVIGRDFAFRILQKITDMHEGLKSHLLNLQGLEFIYEKNLFPELEYIFKHALTQEVAYNSLLLTRRKEIHEQIGNAIEDIYAERLEEFYEMLAYHYSQSKNLEKTYHYLKLSGEKAEGNYSHREAYDYYKQAVAILNKLPDTEKNKRRQIEIRDLMFIAIYFLGFPEDSFETFKQGEEFLKKVGDRKGLAIFYNRIAGAYTWKGNPLSGRKYQENAVREAGEIQDIELLAPFTYDLCLSYILSGECYKTLDVAPKTIALIEKTQRESEFFDKAHNVYSCLLGQYGLGMGACGEFDEGKHFLDKGLNFQQSMNHSYSIGVLQFIYGYFYFFKGDGPGLVKHWRKSLEIMEESQAIVYIGSCWAGIGSGHYYLGELDTAREYMEKGIKIQEDNGSMFGLSIPYWFLSNIYLDSGNPEKAQTCVEEALEISKKTNEKCYEGTSKILLGKILGKADPSKKNKVEELIGQGISILTELKIKPWLSQGHLFLGEYYAAIGRIDMAMQNLKKAEKAFEDMGMDYWLIKTREVLGRL